VSGPEALLLRQEPDGSLATHADLSPFGPLFNEIVVDRRGNAYVNGQVVVLVTPDGSARQVADGIAFGNGMAVTPDGGTLIVAESHGNRLTAFDIGEMATCATGGSGPTSTAATRTGSASTPTAGSGTATCPTSAVSGSGRAARCWRACRSTEAASRARSAARTGEHGSCSRRARAAWTTWTIRGRTGQVLVTEAPAPAAEPRRVGR